MQKTQEYHPDLAVIDFQMPTMNGLEATREIKRLLPNLPVLLFTLHTSPQIEHESKRAGVGAILLKADGTTGLSRVIHSLLQQG